MRPLPLVLLLLAQGCAHRPAPRQGPAPLPATHPPAPASAPPAPAAPALPEALTQPEIQWFDDPAEALGPVLAQKPRVIALGEYHQTSKSHRVRSALRRFIDGVLPRLLYWPSDLVVETWVTEGDCGQTEQAVVKDVRKTTRRPRSTEDEIVTLIRKSAEIGIQPHILAIACADYKALLDEHGEVDYDRLLILLTRELRRQVDAIRAHRDDSPRPILIYGGAVHNDLYPKEAYRNYTYGPELSREVGGRYIEVDLYVPEFVEQDPDITAAPWYARYRQQYRPRQTALIRRAPGSYVVMFPRSS